MIQAVVLAAGESKRMGRPKPLLPFGDRTFLEQIMAILRESRAGGITVVLGARAETVARAIDLDGVDRVINEDYRRGQLSSLIAALERLPAEAEALLLCLVDHPFMTAELVNQVIDAFRETEAPIVIPTHAGRRGHPTLFARGLFAQLMNAPIDEGARRVVYANEDKVHEVAVADRRTLLGVNTPEDYRLHFGADP